MLSYCQASVFSSVLSHLNKNMKQQILKPSGVSQLLDRLCYSSQISVTAPCYSSILFRKQQENPSSRHEGMPTQRREEKRVGEHERERERERDLAFGSSFYMFFPFPGPQLCKLSQPGVLFVLPEVLTLVLDLPLTFLCSILSGFSLPCLLATAILDFCFLF